MTIKRRWEPDELALAADLSIDNADVALELGRSFGSVKRLRSRMAQGWKPRVEYVPLTPDQVEYIATHGSATAEAVAEHLDVPYALVTKARRRLARERGISFGQGPYDKNPHMVGQRLLLGKTCPKCGVLRGGADFHRAATRVSGTCRFCRAEDRGPQDRRRQLVACEDAVRSLSAQVGVEYRAHHAEEYTHHDMEILADPTLTITEKAARLGRTHAATGMAVQAHGFSSRIEPRMEPRGVWIVDARTEDIAAREPDRSEFGKRARKTHCKWGHPLTPDNLYFPKTRGPDCLTCRRIRSENRIRA